MGSLYTLEEAVGMLVAKHGSYRAAGEALKMDHAYLHRLAAGEKVNPTRDVLARMGYERVVLYKRIEP